MSTSIFDVASLGAFIPRFRDCNVAVLGDCMLDRYLWGRVDRISPEAPVPVVEIERESDSLGGAGNVAANLVALGARPFLFGVVGEDAGGERLRAALAEHGVDASGLTTDAARPTTVKTRIIAHSQQVVRADRELRADVTGEQLDALCRALEGAIAKCKALVVSDYGKGVVHRGSLEPALAAARRHGIPVCVDPKESHVDAYRGVTILTPNQHEAGYIQGRRIVDEQSLAEVGWGLRERTDADAVLITRGPQGMSLFERGGRITHMPTVAREVFDVTGAGDTVVGVVALALAAGADLPSACRLSNHAAGVVVAEVGTASCSPAQLLDSIGQDGRS